MEASIQIQKAVLDKLRQLSLKQQQGVLTFVNSTDTVAANGIDL